MSVFEMGSKNPRTSKKMPVKQDNKVTLDSPKLDGLTISEIKNSNEVELSKKVVSNQANKLLKRWNEREQQVRARSANRNSRYLDEE